MGSTKRGGPKWWTIWVKMKTAEQLEVKGATSFAHAELGLVNMLNAEEVRKLKIISFAYT